MTSRDLVNIATGAARFADKQIRQQMAAAVPDLARKHDAGLPKRKALKVGHAGTLDPLAEGVLVVAVGPASRLTEYMHQTEKEYRADFRLGSESASGDLEEPAHQHAGLPVPTERQLIDATSRFLGTISQIPPAHSAIKVDGRAAYKRLREGQTVTVPERQVVIHDLKVIAYDFPDLTLDIVCGSGTYIRTLGMDLAAAVGTKAVMTRLIRTRVGPFHMENAFAIDDIRERRFVGKLTSAAEGLIHMPRIDLNADQDWRIDHGLSLDQNDARVTMSDGKHNNPTDQPQEAIAVAPTGRLRAIVSRKAGQWWPNPVFHDPPEGHG